METVGNMVRGAELDYSKYTADHGTYQLFQTIQQSGFQTVSVGSSGGQESIFELIPKTYNFAKSMFRYQYVPASGGTGNFNIVFNDTTPEIRQIQLYTRSGIFLADIINVNNYLNTVLRPTTKLTEIMGSDSNSGITTITSGALTTTTVWEGLQLCAQGINATTGALTIADPYVPGSATSGAGNTAVVDKITVPNAVIMGALTASATPVYERQFPLSIFKDSIFALDRDLYFGGETLYMRVVWEAPNKVYYSNQSVTQLVSTPVAGTTATVNNLSLYVAIEQNKVVEQELMNKVSSGSFNVLVPYIWPQKINISSSTSHTLNVRLNRGHGSYLKKIWVAPYNTTESLNTAFDHTNIPYASGVYGLPGSKIQYIYALVNGVRTTIQNLYSANTDEYLYLSKKLKGSCIQSVVDYYNNYFWLEDFTNNLPVLLKDNQPPEENQIDGVPLTNTDLIYQFNAVLPSGASYNWYVFPVTQRVLTISNSGGGPMIAWA